MDNNQNVPQWYDRGENIFPGFQIPLIDMGEVVRSLPGANNKWDYKSVGANSGFNGYLKALARNMAYVYGGDVDNWYEWLKIDPEYDYRLRYYNDLLRDNGYLPSVMLPLEYAKNQSSEDGYYKPRFTIQSGKVLRILDDTDVLDAQDYLNENIPGYIAYKPNQANKKEFNNFLTKGQYAAQRDALEQCYKLAHDYGLSNQEIAAIFANIYQESTFDYRAKNHNVAEGLFQFESDLWNKYINWLNNNKLQNTVENQMIFVLNSVYDNTFKYYKNINTPYSGLQQLDKSAIDLFYKDKDVYNVKYGTKYDSSLVNPMSREITNDQAREQLKNGSLEDMTLAFALLFEKPKLTREKDYGMYSRRLDLANIIFDYLENTHPSDNEKKEFNWQPTRQQLETQPTQFTIPQDFQLQKSGNRAFKLGGLLPKRNVLPLI